ncbi:uncharacterized protein PHACADRAFT_126247 [Phanerochaete carnosa HHB-10118-sp]|uniref:ABC1 atypical kinase-like domain-containing protein n=1 Tax=Phanerochaete carnosa (strain HHB-10118-sp) TaxID=650164 RepID=K5W031_PHACS|nr:uncharacterized protein PHACADRAFT_126247 [Phanerochaete carnosa HHB-10118-sp]EKM52440.1 hypothetical protein PHACADRAFT_126247 [Phanerochaete carnosa HHB-10118-sp]
MPPGPAYNWYCVAHGVLEVLGHAAQIRTTQAESGAARLLRREARHVPRRAASAEGEASPALVLRETAPALRHTADVQVRDAPASKTSVRRTAVDASLVEKNTSVPVSEARKAREEPTPSPVPASHEKLLQTSPVVTQHAPELSSATRIPNPPRLELNTMRITEPMISGADSSLVATVTSAAVESQLSTAESSAVTGVPDAPLNVTEPIAIRKLQSSKVPSSRIGRLFHYGGLAASLGYGAASELIRRSTGNSDQHTSLMMTEGNVKRLVSKLTQMRGAALKLGQFMSIQDSHVLPPEIEDVFRRVQDSAHYMPDWQMEEVMKSSLGPSWMDHFASFDRTPFAAASIGQVHSAVLAASSSPTGKEELVAVKIQFPNIVNSIESDLGYVRLLLTAGKLLPKGLFLDKTIAVMKEELADECDYTREASFLKKFGEPSYLGSDPRFKVPWVWEGSSERVLVMEMVDGVSVGGNVIEGMPQEDRNKIATGIIDLCLKELFVFRTMQTDPNWTNFLWNKSTRRIELVDFGATREYSKEFIGSWFRLLQAAASDDRQACIGWSLKVGYLTGEENELMLDAHATSMSLLATPFKARTPQPFAFGPHSSWADITAQIRAQIPVMLQHRLTPPPRETYSLNRKLSGAFLLAARLDAKVDTKKLWDDVVSRFRF